MGWDNLRTNRFQPDKARSTLGLPLAAREPILPYRYRMMARNAYDAADSEMTESELSALFRMDRVAARDELEELRSQTDDQTDDGFERIDLDPNKLLLAV